MSFPEKVKSQALINSAFRCCICHDLASDVHHIVLRSKNGSNSLKNAAPLCSTCHDLFGDNPVKEKKIRQMRDYWWKVVKARNDFIIKTGDFEKESFFEIDPNSQFLLKNKQVSLYHVIREPDTFENAAKVLVFQISEAQKDYPNQERVLFIDIEGHRNNEGGFDHDMFELQLYFNLNVILPYVTQIYSPLISVQNKYPQQNDVPDKIDIKARPN